MLLYILRRLASAVSVIFVTLVATFGLFYLAPTDPAGVICGPKCTPARYEEIYKSLHLNEPFYQQMLGYFQGLFVGRTFTSGGVTIECSAPCLGYSYALGQPVTKLLGQALPITISIVFGSAIAYLIIGVAAGTFAARRRGTSLDRFMVGGTLVVGSVPYFVVALVAALYVPQFLPFIPKAHWTPLTENPLSWFAGLLLPWLVLGIVNSASYTRYSRGSMIESLGEDYVRTARSKGITERRVVYRHALRSAMTPIATIFGLDVAFALTGALFTETIFGLPGLGLLTLRAFNQYDLPVLMGGALIGVVVLVLINLLVDLLYTVLDPRVRLA
ncbi:MAG: ABC transporter permease [Hamadaea sp.]|uniref:ABC transporter permease n=1 Tax=Hamadaea sp. TaxID=2024425 RepID=UPI001793DDB0|nr:ABC transporter permease [Hamadaea sp.]NUR70190.1 ABC transporter permease [Hamadaea sp.]NUT24143.1 ABC transporter permease [Hamadaea sp.]